MPKKTGILLFCRCCSNGTLDGTCMYGREAECALTEEHIREVANRLNRIMELHKRQAKEATHGKD